MDRGITTPTSRGTVSRLQIMSASKPSNFSRKATTLTAPASASKLAHKPIHNTLSGTDAKAISSAIKQTLSQKSAPNASSSAIPNTENYVRQEKIKSFLRIKPAESDEKDAFKRGMGRVNPGDAGATRPSIIMTAESRPPQSITGVTTQTHKTHEFFLDGIFDQASSQVEVYDATVKGLVDDLITGKSFTVATYGMTGSGKTHTFWGEPADATLSGLVPRFFEDLFDKLRIQTSDENVDGLFTASVEIKFFELYNDSLYDLLQLAEKISSLGPLKGAARDFAIESAYKSCKVDMTYINNNNTVDVSIPDAKVAVVHTVEDAISLLTPAMAVRRSASTSMNAHSSRSHAILQVKVSCTARTTEKLVRSEGLASLVDLAGSERQKRTGAVGTNLREAGAINNSLLTLGNVMKSLADQHRAPKSGVIKANFKAWRDDLLTQILHPCLDGSSRVAFIITVSPDPLDWEQSLSSLDFARRAGQILVKPAEKLIVEDLPNKSNPNATAGTGEDAAMMSEGLTDAMGGMRRGVAGGGGEGVNAASPLVQRALRDLRLLSSNFSVFSNQFTALETVPVPADVAGTSSTVATSDATDVGAAYLRDIGRALATALAENERLRLAQLHSTTGNSDSTPAMVTRLRNLEEAVSTSGEKRPRSSTDADVAHGARNVRRRISEEAFVNDTALDTFLADDGDYLEAAQPQAPMIDDHRIEAIINNVFNGSQAADLITTTQATKQRLTEVETQLQQARDAKRTVAEYATRLNQFTGKMLTFVNNVGYETLSSTEGLLSSLLEERRQLRVRVQEAEDARAKMEAKLQLSAMRASVMMTATQQPAASAAASTPVRDHAASVPAEAAAVDCVVEAEEEITFHPRVASKVHYAGNATPDDKKSVSTDDVDGAVDRAEAPVDASTTASAAAAQLDDTTARRPRRLLFPRVLSTGGNDTTDKPAKQTETQATKQFVDPYFKPREAAKPPQEAEMSTDVTTQPDINTAASENEENAVTPTETTPSVECAGASSGNSVSCDAGAALSNTVSVSSSTAAVVAQPSAMKPKKRIGLKDFIQTVPLNQPTGI